MVRTNDRPNLVVTRTPLRISFAGGGTDLPDFFMEETGMVLSTTIDKYVYVTVKAHGKLFNENYRLNYADTEHVNNLDDIKNDIARECLRLVQVETPIYISTVADLPASSGLGSSSSFAVGLLNALHAMRNDKVSMGQLFEEATQVEIDVLKHPIGKQDQAAVSYGGFNSFSFISNGSVQIQSHSAQDKFKKMFDCMQLFWTGISRDSSSILVEQKRNTSNRMESLRRMRKQAEMLSEIMHSDGCVPIDVFGGVLDDGWKLKQNLAQTISNNRVDNWYATAKKAGAIGGKLCGAGGGGFLLFVSHPEHHNSISAGLCDLEEVSIKYEPHGTYLMMAQ